MTEVKLIKLSPAARLKKAATSLYAFLENPESVRHPDAFLSATAHLMDTTSVELDLEITQLKRTLGGLNAKVSKLEREVVALQKTEKMLQAKIDRLHNGTSPIVGMAAGYDG